MDDRTIDTPETCDNMIRNAYNYMQNLLDTEPNRFRIYMITCRLDNRDVNALRKYRVWKVKWEERIN